MADLIIRNPEIMHGAPCFTGTRIPVSVLFDNLTDGMGIEEILEQYPSMNREQVIAVLDQSCRRLEVEAPVVHD